jgi:3-deoxy-7-phosphoheptulonate synthase
VKFNPPAAMIVVMKKNAEARHTDAVVGRIEALGLHARLAAADSQTLVVVQGDVLGLSSGEFRALDGVEDVVAAEKPYRLVSREEHPANTVVRVGNACIGGGELTVIAGPCSVESREQLQSIARFVKQQGAAVLRGGAFKPRSSPYSFQGLGEEALELMAEVGRETGLPVVTEVLSPEYVPAVAAHADMLQIGSRNMHNFALLRAAGRAGKPVLLKRGMAATIEEFLLAAEHLAVEGCGQIVLCERGIRTFEPATRNTLDLSAVPILKQLTHLPVVVDPCHAAGRRELVLPLARAAIAAGADGVMIEVHPQPETALSDGPQSLRFDDFGRMMEQLRRVAAALNPKESR